MRIVTYHQINRTAWSALVMESETGTWFQSPEAYAFFASMPELFAPFAIGAERVNESTNERTLRAVCVGYVTREKNAIAQYFTRRAIIQGGVCCANDASDEEIEVLLSAVRDQLNSKTIYIETRNFNDYSPWKDAFAHAGFSYLPHLNFHLDCTDKEKMWERLSERRRRQVKKALKNRVEIKNEGINELEIREFYQILSHLYRTKVKTPLFEEAFFLEAYRQRVANYLLVKYEGQVIGGMMIVTSSNCVYEWYICGLDAEYKEQYPSVMATWTAMEYAHQHHLARFDVMGAGEPGVPYGVRDFKAEFGGELVEQGRFLHVAKPILFTIGKIGVKMLKSLHF